LGLGIAWNLGDKIYTHPKNSLWIFVGIIVRSLSLTWKDFLCGKETMIATRVMFGVSNPPNHMNFMLLLWILLIYCVYWIFATIMEALKLNIYAFYYLGVSKIKWTTWLSCQN
jgi:hypothetical protein